MVQKDRIVWVDVAKYICIMFVMLTHLESCTNELRTFFNPFFLNLFFLLSGYTYKHKESFGKFLIKKSKTLLIPWFVFGLSQIALTSVLTFNFRKELLIEIAWFLLQVRGHGDAMWFIAALFVAYIPFYFFIKQFERRANENNIIKCSAVAILIAWLLSVVSIIYTKTISPSILPWNSAALPWHFEYMFQAMFYMAIGYMLKRCKYDSFIDKRNTIIFRLLLFVLYLAAVYIPNYKSSELGFKILYDFFIQLLGIVLIISVSKKIKSNKYIQFVGQNTLLYFAMHGRLLSVIQVLMKMFLPHIYEQILASGIISSIFAVVLTVCMSFILIIPTLFINRYLPFLVGKKYTTKKNEVQV